MQGRIPKHLDGLSNLIALSFAGYLVFHLWQVGGALEGLDAWWQRLALTRERPGLALAIGVSAGVALVARGALHAYTACRLALPRDVRVGRIVTSVLALAFLAFHLWHVSWPPLGTGPTPRQLFDVLWQQAGRLWVLAAYVGGSTAVYAELGSRCVPKKRISRWRVAAWVGLAALWVWGLHVFGRFANGEGLWR